MKYPFQRVPVLLPQFKLRTNHPMDVKMKNAQAGFYLPIVSYRDPHMSVIGIEINPDMELISLVCAITTFDETLY